MPVKTAKITSKGQTTIPKEIRDVLNSDIVEFEVVEGTVVVRPVLSIGGSLGRYSKKYVPVKEAREAAWEEAIREKSGKKTP